MIEKAQMMRAEHLSKSFDGLAAVQDFSIRVPEQRISAIIGPNGAGKSTLFHLMTGFLKPDTGAVWFGSSNVTRLPPHRIAQMGIARTFQDLRLVRRMTVLENVMLAATPVRLEGAWVALRRGLISRTERSTREAALDWLNFVQLSDKAHDPASEISYGQQKLLALACALATDATLLLLDEPFAGVSPAILDRLIDYIRQLPALMKTVLFIEHNLAAVQAMADRVIVMDEGRKIAEGTWQEVAAAAPVLEAYLA